MAAVATYVILLTVRLTVALDEELPKENKVFIPAMHPTRKIRFYPVTSWYLVLDMIRNPKLNVTINTYSDFLEYPKLNANSHFIPISDTGFGMTLSGMSALKINQEIDYIVDQLPTSVKNVTFYQYKDINNFPNKNVFSGSFTKTHLRPHQNFYRNI